VSSKTKIIILCIVFLAIGAGLGYFFEYNYNYQQTKSLISNILPVRQNNFNYKFIYPLLRYDFGNARYYLENKDLEQKVNSYIQQQYQNKNAESVSVYFSNLTNGQWSGVNYNDEYYPGSMAKVLVMMAYYRESQLDHSVMKKTFAYSQSIDKALHGVSPQVTDSNLVIGQSYTIKYLIEDMIENSDDGAELVLYLNVDKNVLNAIYEDLKIEPPSSSHYTISAKDYVMFLKVLYNSTYLTEANSSAALSTMSQSTYNDGLVAGVPSGISVAHKYGENGDIDPATKQLTSTELHDCGIIYAKEYSYALCVMTKANGVIDQKQLASIIKNISGIVYNYVSSGEGK